MRVRLLPEFGSRFAALMACLMTVAISAAASSKVETSEPAAAESPGADGSGAVVEGSGEDTASRPDVPTTPDRPPAPLLFDDSPARGVLIVEIDGEITPGMAAFVTRAVDEVGSGAGAPVDLLVVRVDTFGGRVDSAVQIRDALLSAQVPVLAFVQNRAISAGALITYAADHIVFAGAASMGAATPIQVQGGEAVPVDEKVVSYMRAEMRATADANGRRPDIAEAMVDRTVAIPDVVNAETLLTVTTGEAVALGIADGVAADMEELLDQVGAKEAPKRTLQKNWAERLAIFITTPAVAGLLMSLGILGIWVEIKAPGFGAPGIIGILALAAFFFGHTVVHLAGWEEVILLLGGLILLLVEIFVVPGFGVPGILGVGCLVAAFVLAMVGLPVGVSWEIGSINLAAFRVFFSLLVVVFAMLLLGRYLPERALPSWLVLRASIDDESGARSQGEGPSTTTELIGKRGVATTDLRPAGRARVDGRVIDVVSRTDWVDKGATVEVVEVAGVRIAVDLVEPPPTAASAAEPAVEVQSPGQLSPPSGAALSPAPAPAKTADAPAEREPTPASDNSDSVT